LECQAEAESCGIKTLFKKDFCLRTFMLIRIVIIELPKKMAQKKGKLLSSHRSTIYPCYVPILGDLTGAGRERLTRGKNIKNISYIVTIY
jgi:hypothetical protein